MSQSLAEARLEQEVCRLIKVELDLRQTITDLKKELHGACEARGQQAQRIHDMRTCENCTMQGCQSKTDKDSNVACQNNDYSKWEFIKHQSLIYDLREELCDAQKTNARLTIKLWAMRNCDNCNERHCGDNENLGIACMNNEHDKWEFEP